MAALYPCSHSRFEGRLQLMVSEYSLLSFAVKVNGPPHPFSHLSVSSSILRSTGYWWVYEKRARKEIFSEHRKYPCTSDLVARSARLISTQDILGESRGNIGWQRGGSGLPWPFELKKCDSSLLIFWLMIFKLKDFLSWKYSGPKSFLKSRR